MILSDHAVTRYIERMRPRLSHEEAVRELEQLCAGAHRVRAINEGLELWRTARPSKLRLRVQPGDPPTLVTVLTPFDAYEPAAIVRGIGGRSWPKETAERRVAPKEEEEEEEEREEEREEAARSSAITSADLAWASTARFARQVDRAREAVERAIKIGRIGISYSGGKDSTVLLHVVRSVVPAAPAAFYDSGCELASTYELVRAMGVTIVAPRMSMLDMARYAGWWDCADPVDKGCPFDAKRVLIEEPAEAFVVRERLRVIAYGLRAGESNARAKSAHARGELFEGADRTWYSQPLAYWSTQDVWAYIASRGLPYNAAYDRMTEARVDRASQRVATLLGARGSGWGRHAIMRAAEPERFRELAREFPGLYRMT